MSASLKPGSETELSEIVPAAEGPLEIIGTGTKRGLGRPVQAAAHARHVGLCRHHRL